MEKLFVVLKQIASCGFLNGKLCFHNIFVRVAFKISIVARLDLKSWRKGNATFHLLRLQRHSRTSLRSSYSYLSICQLSSLSKRGWNLNKRTIDKDISRVRSFLDCYLSDIFFTSLHFLIHQLFIWRLVLN